MQNNRKLSWDGCSNIRDLGGLLTKDRKKIRWGALVRADHPNRLSAEGWEALYAHGIRTIISLKTDGLHEEELVIPNSYQDINTISAPIEDVIDLEFREKWASSDLWSTPLYYPDAIARWPERHTAVFKTIAAAPEGGVLYHCQRGVDRTGIITLMILALLGVPDDVIMADYLMSTDPDREMLLAEQNTTTGEVLRGVLEHLEIEAYLISGGISQAELEKIKVRVLETG